jgi:hypothetical protein
MGANGDRRNSYYYDNCIALCAITLRSWAQVGDGGVQTPRFPAVFWLSVPIGHRLWLTGVTLHTELAIDAAVLQTEMMPLRMAYWTNSAVLPSPRVSMMRAL